MQASNLLVEVLRQHIDLVLVLAGLGEELDLRQVWLVNEADMTKDGCAGGVAEVQEAAFRQQDDAVALGELDHVDLRLDVRPLEVSQRRNLDLVVEVADVADDRHVLHRAHVVDADDVLVAGCGDEDVGRRDDVFELDALRNRPSAACRAQIGSTSVTLTRAPAPESEAAEPLPTSP